MTDHQFTVNVPNPTAQSASVQLRLEPARRQDFDWLSREYSNTALEIIDMGLALDPCARAGKPTLKLKLEPFSSVDVHVVINTATSKKPGAAGFHLVDQRRGKDVGGVFLVCVDPPFAEPAGQVVSVANPCKAILAADIYTIPPGDDPSQASRTRPIRPGDSLELVAQITNPTGRPLKDVQAYLEHLGSSNVEFTAGTWNIGTLSKGDVFYATWPICATRWQTGSYEASIVVVSQGAAPVRLNGKISLALRDK